MAVVVADNTPAPSYRPVAPTRYSEPSNDVPPNYNFQWLVQDDYANLNYGQNEERNDYATSGSYSVDLPDGRTQTVTYRVDDAYSGYIADVQYSGEARYDDPAPHPAPSYSRPSPSYRRPAPAHAPAPSYSNWGV